MTNGRSVAVITGGTHGIGRHTAELLASDGWSVAVCSRHAEEADEAAAALAEQYGTDAIGAAVDVRSPSELRRFADKVCNRLGTPQAAVANAGVLGPVGSLHRIDLDEWATAVAIDLVGVANTLAVFGGLMVGAGRGSLVTMSGGGVGGPNVATALSAYTCSKAAVVVLTETVAGELAPHGVSVNAVAPGAIATRFMEPVLAAGPSSAGEELFRQTTAQRERPDSLDAFDALLRFLLDPESPFVTGRTLSARWDDPASLAEDAPPAASSRYRLRRIDGVLYDELPRGR